MKRIITALALALATAVLLSGCSFLSYKPIESLMMPPSFSGQNEELVAAFNLAAGESTAFSPPVSGDYTSAIVMEDVDSDKVEEAFIFYTLKSGEGTVRVNFLDVIDGEWTSVSDFSGSGSGVDKVMFVDMDGNGISEVLVCWRVGSTSGRILSVYKRLSASEPESFREIMNESYSTMTCADIDGDSQSEIFLVSQSSTAIGNQSTARTLKLKGSKMIVSGSAKLDGNVSSYVSLKSEKTGENSPLRIYIDAFKGESQMITEVVYWSEESGDLKAPFLDAETMTNTATLRYEPIPSFDINNDGSIDIPVQSPMLVPQGKPEAEAAVEEKSSVYLTVWSNVEGEALVPARYSVINAAQRYIFYLEEDEIGNLFVNEQTESCWVFYSFDKDRQATYDLFSVLSLEPDAWSNKTYEQYSLLLENTERVVCAYISSSGKAIGLDNEKLLKRVAEFTY